MMKRKVAGMEWSTYFGGGEHLFFFWLPFNFAVFFLKASSRRTREKTK